MFGSEFGQLRERDLLAWPQIDESQVPTVGVTLHIDLFTCAAVVTGTQVQSFTSSGSRHDESDAVPASQILGQCPNLGRQFDLGVRQNSGSQALSTPMRIGMAVSLLPSPKTATTRRWAPSP